MHRILIFCAIAAYAACVLGDDPGYAYPGGGPVAGGNLVSLQAVYYNMGNGTDIYAVKFGNSSTFGVDSTILSQTATAVLVRAPPHQAGSVTAYIKTPTSDGGVVGYFYHYQTTNISSVTPWIGPNGILVTIAAVDGTRLGTGSDITSVTVCDLPAALLNQTAASVVVTTPAVVIPYYWGLLSGGPWYCDVQVNSTSLGSQLLRRGFVASVASTAILSWMVSICVLVATLFVSIAVQ